MATPSAPTAAADAGAPGTRPGRPHAAVLRRLSALTRRYSPTPAALPPAEHTLPPPRGGTAGPGERVPHHSVPPAPPARPPRASSLRGSAPSRRPATRLHVLPAPQPPGKQRPPPSPRPGGPWGREGEEGGDRHPAPLTMAAAWAGRRGPVAPLGPAALRGRRGARSCALRRRRKSGGREPGGGAGGAGLPTLPRPRFRAA